MVVSLLENSAYSCRSKEADRIAAGYFFLLFLRNPATRIVKKAVGMVAKTRKTSRSFFALARAVVIPSIPSNKKYHPYPCILFSSVLVMYYDAGQAFRLTDAMRGGLSIRLTWKYFLSARRYRGSWSIGIPDPSTRMGDIAAACL